MGEGGVGGGTMLGSGFFCAACKGKALFSTDADPAHCCMHAGSRLASQQRERKGLPTDDTQHTEDMDLHREVSLPTKEQLYSANDYFMFCINLLISYNPRSLQRQQLLFHFRSREEKYS